MRFNTTALPLIGLLTSTLTATHGQTAKTALAVRVEQGGVARWAGDCKRCSMETRSWAAVDGSCYYPIDMDRKPGSYTISRRTPAGQLDAAKLTVVAKPCKQEDFTNFPKPEFVTVSAANMARATREAVTLAPLLAYHADERPPVFALPVGKPANPLPKATPNFGNCRSFNGQPRDRHSGMDYPVTGGESVLSAANGKVILAADNFYSGNAVFVDHGNGLITEYFHLKAISVKPNQTVTKGQKIGSAGETGRTTGPHLHFGARWHGAKINPGYLLTTPSDLVSVR
jgi:murein DD-endopeptidase MepM/ murein hydrolase activator NlpD